MVERRRGERPKEESVVVEWIERESSYARYKPNTTRVD